MPIAFCVNLCALVYRDLRIYSFTYEISLANAIRQNSSPAIHIRFVLLHKKKKKRKFPLHYFLGINFCVDMSYQGLSREDGKVEILLEISGTDLLGLPLKAPLAKYERVYVLPMLHINPDKVITRCLLYMWWILAKEIPRGGVSEGISNVKSKYMLDLV